MGDDLSIPPGNLDFNLVVLGEEGNILDYRLFSPAFNHMGAEDGRSSAPFHEPAQLIVGGIVWPQGADCFLAVVHAIDGSKNISVLINSLINAGGIPFLPGVMEIGKRLLGKIIGFQRLFAASVMD